MLPTELPPRSPEAQQASTQIERRWAGRAQGFVGGDESKFTDARL
jgi:hypothetical protein